MAALVQTATGNNAAGATTTVSATFAAPPTPGNLLVTMMPIAATNVPAGAGPWGAAADVISQITGSMRVFIYSKVAVAGESSTVTMTFSVSQNTHRLNLYEFSPTKDYLWAGLGQSAINQDTGVAAATLSSGTTGMTAATDGVAVAGFSMSNTITGVTLTNGYTPLLNPAAPLAVTGHLILSAAGTQETTAAWPTARRVAGAIAVYKQAKPALSSGSFISLLGA